MNTVTTFLMFDGQAEAAMNFYTSLFENSEITSMRKYTAEGPGKEGTVMVARFTMNGQTYMAIDSAVEHDFVFTPSISLYVDCTSEAEIDRLFAAISQGGNIFMPLNNYGFSDKFGWTTDRFGVSWQLNLTKS